MVGRWQGVEEEGRGTEEKEKEEADYELVTCTPDLVL